MNISKESQFGAFFSFVSKSSAQWMNIGRNSLQTNTGNKNTFYNLKYC